MAIMVVIFSIQRHVSASSARVTLATAAIAAVLADGHAVSRRQ